MKTKLLRKVRKEFKIEYWPNGIEGFLKESPLVQLKADTWAIKYVILPLAAEMELSHVKVVKSKDEAVKQAIDKIIETVKDRYPHLGSYRKKFTKQQIWP